MKREDEIKHEVIALAEEIHQYRSAFTGGIITERNWRIKYAELSSSINALKWVLGENDRLD